MNLGAVRLIPASAPALLGQARPARRPSLGAEELVELGQARPGGTPQQRAVVITASEGQLMIKVVENLISFSKDYAIEFHSYCPTDRWEMALTDVGTWIHEIERQIIG